MPTKVETTVIAKSELIELADWEQKYADAKKALAEAEKQIDWRRLSLATKALGIKTKDEFRTLSPEKIDALMTKRYQQKEWRLERGAPTFLFIKTYEGQTPAWARIYEEEFGEAEADRIRAETPKLYSYKVEVAV